MVHACFLCTVAKPFTWFVLELNSRFQSAYCIPCEFEADMLYISLLSTFKISLCKLRYYQLMKRICPGQARTGDPQCGGRQELRRIHEVWIFWCAYYAVGLARGKAPQLIVWNILRREKLTCLESWCSLEMENIIYCHECVLFFCFWQVDNLRKHVHDSGIMKKIDLVIVSPLLR